MKVVGQIAKAITAGALAGLGALGGYLVNNTALSDVTAGQWVYVAIAALATGAAVWGVPNAVQKK